MIDDGVKEEEGNDYDIRILVLGSHGAGCSTLLRELTVLFAEVGGDRLSQCKLSLRQQVLLSVLSHLPPNHQLAVNTQQLLDRNDNVSMRVIAPYVEELYALWDNDETFRGQFDAEDTSIFFLNQPDRLTGLLDDNMRLPIKDFLLWKQPGSESIEKVRFAHFGNHFQMSSLPLEALPNIDVHRYTAVIYVLNLSSIASEANGRYELQQATDALNRLRRVCGDGDIRIMFYLNKVDVFNARYAADCGAAFKTVFPEFQGMDAECALEHICRYFYGHFDELYTHRLVPFDLDNIHFIFNATSEIVLRRNLAATGFYDDYPMKGMTFDIGFANTEALIDTCANCSAACQHHHSPLRWIISGLWTIITWIGASVLILPGLFALLVLRSDQVETDIDNFHERERVLDTEGSLSLARATRWWHFFVRSISMTIFIFVWPAILCFIVFPRISEGAVIAILSIHFLAVLAFQLLGVSRAATSWWANISISAKPNDRQPEPTFSFSDPMHITLVLTLLSELLQVTTLPMQEHKDTTSQGNVDVHHFAPPWLTTLNSVIFIQFADVGASISWIAEAAIPVVVVAILISVIAACVINDINMYGNLKYQQPDGFRAESRKMLATEYLFHSLTGAIIYGHGKPWVLSKRLRLLVSILTDVLFLTITNKLLGVLQCQHSSSSDHPVMVTGDNDVVTCWRGEHALWSFLSLVALSYYVPMTIMLAPIVMQGATQLARAKATVNSKIVFLKLYSMVIASSKAFMLMVTALAFTEHDVYLSIQFVTLFLLAALSGLWIFRYGKPECPMSLHPCTHAFFSRFRTLIYLCGAWSCAWCLAGSVSQSTSTAVTVVGWTAALALSCWWYYTATTSASLKGNIQSPDVAANTAEFELELGNTQVISDTASGPLPIHHRQGNNRIGLATSQNSIDCDKNTITTDLKPTIVDRISQHTKHVSRMIQFTYDVSTSRQELLREIFGMLWDPSLLTLAQDAADDICSNYQAPVSEVESKSDESAARCSTRHLKVGTDLAEISMEISTIYQQGLPTEDRDDVAVCCRFELGRYRIRRAGEVTLLCLDCTTPGNAIQCVCSLLQTGFCEGIEYVGFVILSASGRAQLASPILPIDRLDAGDVCAKLYGMAAQNIPYSRQIDGTSLRSVIAKAFDQFRQSQSKRSPASKSVSRECVLFMCGACWSKIKADVLPVAEGMHGQQYSFLEIRDDAQNVEVDISSKCVQLSLPAQQLQKALSNNADWDVAFTPTLLAQMRCSFDPATAIRKIYGYEWEQVADQTSSMKLELPVVHPRSLLQSNVGCEVWGVIAFDWERNQKDRSIGSLSLQIEDAVGVVEKTTGLCELPSDQHDQSKMAVIFRAIWQLIHIASKRHRKQQAEAQAMLHDLEAEMLRLMKSAPRISYLAVDFLLGRNSPQTATPIAKLQQGCLVAFRFNVEDQALLLGKFMRQSEEYVVLLTFYGTEVIVRNREELFVPLEAIPPALHEIFTKLDESITEAAATFNRQLTAEIAHCNHSDVRGMLYLIMQLTTILGLTAE